MRQLDTCKRCAAAFADRGHEPGDGSVGDDEGDDEADSFSHRRNAVFTI